MAEQVKSEASWELFRSAVAGDDESLDRLLASYREYLSVLSSVHLDKRIRHRVSPSDIVQETLLEAHRDFPNFRGEGLEQFTGWLRRVLLHNVSHAVGTHLLAEKRSVRREQILGGRSGSADASYQRLSALVSDPRRSPASEADHQESLVELADALEKLPCDYRTVIVLRHLEGRAFEEVAERMQRTTGATRMLWLRAIERLRQVLEKQT